MNGEPAAGEIVELRTSGGKFIGKGFYNPQSLIAVRILTFHDNGLAEEEPWGKFFRERIGGALALRGKMFPGANSYRLVHGEGDFLPGLIIDRYADILCVQTLSAGMEKHLGTISEALDELVD